MSNVTSNLPSVVIQEEEVEFRSAISEGFLKRVGGVINYLLANGQVMPVGSYKMAFLTEAQFQAQMGDTWVLCDGSDVTGSDYETLTGSSTIPDARGLFLVNKRNSRAAGQTYTESDLGTFLPDALENHSHSTTVSFGNTLTNNLFTGAGAAKFQPLPAGAATVTLNIDVVGSGGNEVRQKNVTGNIFIKINN